MRRTGIALLAVAGLLIAATCGGHEHAAAPAAAPRPSSTAPPPPPPATLLAAGDIASCASSGDEATADLLDSLVAAHPDAVVAALGDLAYESGTLAEFAQCYGPTWGRQKARTRPAMGNHDVLTPDAAGYRAYFGTDPPERSEPWYSYDLGAWHVVVLDSNCSLVGCAAGGEQERWLRSDLAAHARPCTLAYWHHPRFSSGVTHGSDSSVAPLFHALYEAGADVVLAGHEHNYERFAPLDSTGNQDPTTGVRSFVVGTGGASHYPFGSPLAGSEVRDETSFGVLVLTLRADSYEWEFVPAAGGTFRDRGSGRCH